MFQGAGAYGRSLPTATLPGHMESPMPVGIKANSSTIERSLKRF